MMTGEMSEEEKKKEEAAGQVSEQAGTHKAPARTVKHA